MRTAITLLVMAGCATTNPVQVAQTMPNAELCYRRIAGAPSQAIIDEYNRRRLNCTRDLIVMGERMVMNQERQYQEAVNSIADAIGNIKKPPASPPPAPVTCIKTGNVLTCQ